jgi:hypothetical protein
VRERVEFGAGEVVGEALGLYRRFFVRFLGLSLAVYAIVNLLAAALDVTSSSAVRLVLFVATFVASIVGFFWLQGALIVQVEDVRDGTVDTSFGEVFARTRPRVADLVLLGLLIGLVLGAAAAVVLLASGLAHVLLVGILVVFVGIVVAATRWMVSAQAVVLESLGPVAALRRSNELVQGHSWRAFWVIVITSILSGAVGGIARGIVGAGLHGFLRTWIAGTIGSAIAAPLVAVAWTVAYHRLRGDD